MDIFKFVPAWAAEGPLEETDDEHEEKQTEVAMDLVRSSFSCVIASMTCEITCSFAGQGTRGGAAQEAKGNLDAHLDGCLRAFRSSGRCDGNVGDRVNIRPQIGTHLSVRKRTSNDD